MSFAEGSVKGADAPLAVPGLSIIIPVHNQWPLTRACIDSLLGYPLNIPFEIVIVDDGSTDETVEKLEELVRSDGRIRGVANTAPHRFARACNCGARSARGELLLFMNNDIEVRSPGWFEPLAEVLQQRPEVGIVAPRLLFPDETVQHCGKVWHLDQFSWPRSEHYLYEQSAKLPEACQGGSFLTITGACMLLRREQFFTIGPFDERYENGWEDDDLCLAFRSQGLLSWVCADTTLIHHQGGTLKAEALVLERYLGVLKGKGITLAADDPLLIGMQQQARAKAEQFERVYQNNWSLFFAKWGEALPRLLKPGSEQRDAATIVIVTYNSAATIAACLESLERTVAASDRVVVVDNNSRDTTCAIIETFQSKLLLELIQNKENRGFSVATNQGIRQVKTPLVVLLNPDTVVTECWLDRLAGRLNDPKIAAVGPVSNFAAARQSVACHWSGTLPNGVSPEQAADQLYQMNKGKSEEARLLIGFCLMIRRSVLEQLGGLDERLFLGNDDLELSWRLRIHNYRLLIATDCFVWHEGQHSFKTDSVTTTGRLLQESSDALYWILAAHYGSGRVPVPRELWGVDWFSPSCPVFNPTVGFNQILRLPKAWKCPTTADGKPLVSLVILTFNQWDVTEECLASIKRHTPEPYELIVVDNGSTDGTPQRLMERAAEDGRYRLVLNPENRGYAAGCNQGMHQACGSYIVLLNNDVIVTPEWLTGLLECHASDPLAGIVGPLTNNASGIQVVSDPDYADSGELDAFARQFRVQHRFRKVNSRRIVGFCMLFSRSLTDKIGLLDEQFGTGNYEDDDFCIRSAVAGHQNMIAADVYIHHHGSISFRANRIDYGSALSKNAALFQKKWSQPVTDPVLGKQIAVYRMLEQAERFLLDERYKEAEKLLLICLRDHPDDIRVQNLAGRVKSASASDVMPADQDDRAYADALLVNRFMLEPWYSQLQKALLKAAQRGVDGLLSVVDEAFRLYPLSRGLARLRVELAALDQCPKLLSWAEEFLVVFGPDDQVLQAALAQRRECGPHQATAEPGRSVSLCMIVKDEENSLARCLASCKPLVHEIVVVDTGSSDRTVLIAELFGAKVAHYAWQEDFSHARNRSLDLATGNWILVMDADEVLSARDRQIFNAALAATPPDRAFVMTTRNYSNTTSYEGFVPCQGEYPEDEAGAGWTASDKVRIFPNQPEIRFQGRIHEMVEDTVRLAGLQMEKHQVPIHHYGELLKRSNRDKQLRYLELGLQKLAESPDDQKALYELAVQAGELEQFATAERLWRNLLRLQPEFARGWFNLGYVLLRTGDLQESLAASQKAVVLDSTLTDALVNSALAEVCICASDEAFRKSVEAQARCPENTALIALVALGLYRVGRAMEGRALLQGLADKGISCTQLLQGVAAIMEQKKERTDLVAVYQALSDASAVSPSAEAASTSSCS